MVSASEEEKPEAFGVRIEDMLRKTNRVYGRCDASQREPLFLRVSPGGESAISLTSYLRNGIHPQMAVSPTPLGLFLRDLQFAALRVRRFVNDTFISDNLQDEFAIDIYQRNPGRGFASISALMEYLLIPAQRDGEIELSASAARTSCALPLWMNHIKLQIKRFFVGLSKQTIMCKKIVWPNLLTTLGAIKAIPENHKEYHLTLQVEDPNS